jgi:hypothetical protein
MITTDDPIAALERELVRAAGDLPRAAAPRRRRRRAVVSTIAIAVPVAAALLLVAALSGGGSSPSLLDRAAAALAPRGGIVHLRLMTTFTDRAVRVQDEEWIADGVEHSRLVVRSTRTGRVRELDESVRTPRSLLSYSSIGNVIVSMRLCAQKPVSTSSDLAFATDPVAVVRARVRDGQLIDTGPSTFRSIAVERYVPRSTVAGIRRERFLLDRRTGRPVAMIFPDGDGAASRAVTRFTVDTHLPLTRANRALLRLSPHPGARRLRGRAVCH